LWPPAQSLLDGGPATELTSNEINADHKTKGRTMHVPLLRHSFELAVGAALLSSSVLSAVSPDDGKAQTVVLTRKLAASVIARDPRFASARAMSLADPGKTSDAGVREGLWIKQGFGGLSLLADGQRFFTQLDGFPDYFAVLREPARREIVEVTGIADAPVGRNTKEVQFRWRYVGLPEVVARYCGQGPVAHDSTALLRLYDDGWRVEQLELKETSRIPFAGVPAAVVNREVEARDRFVARLKQSTLPTHRIGTYSWSYNGYMRKRESAQAVLTDAGFRVGSACYWFGQISSLKQERYPPNSGYSNELQIVAFFKSSSAGLRLEATDALPGSFSAFASALVSAHDAWRASYSDIANSLASHNYTNLTAQVKSDQSCGTDDNLAVDDAGALPTQPAPSVAGAGATHTSPPEVLSIDEAVLAAEIRNGEPMGVSDRFRATARSIVCYVIVSNERAGQVVEFVWTEPTGFERARSSTVLAEPNATQSQFAFGIFRPRAILPKGEWRVDIIADGMTIRQLRFNVL
jgi:hypothetical protein